MPEKYINFTRIIKKEHWAEKIRNNLIAHKRRDKSKHFIPITELPNFFVDDPNAVRTLGENLKEVLFEILNFYKERAWFPELRELIEKEKPLP